MAANSIKTSRADITATADKRRVVLRFAFLLGMLAVIAYFLDGPPLRVFSNMTAWIAWVVAAAVLWVWWARPRLDAHLELHGSILTDTILKRTMQLDNLASVQHFADRSGEFFYLKDQQGNMFVIQMSYYSPQQLGMLFSAMRSYVLAPAVEQKKALGFAGVTCDVWFNNYLKRYSPVNRTISH